MKGPVFAGSRSNTRGMPRQFGDLTHPVINSKRRTASHDLSRKARIAPLKDRRKSPVSTTTAMIQCSPKTEARLDAANSARNSGRWQGQVRAASAPQIKAGVREDPEAPMLADFRMPVPTRRGTMRRIAVADGRSPGWGLSGSAVHGQRCGASRAHLRRPTRPKAAT